MIGEDLKDSKVRWAVQQAWGELTQAILETEDTQFRNQLENIRRGLSLVTGDAEDREA